MAIKTFVASEVLNATDTNTYLANSGLVFVKSQTVGNGVSSVTVSDAFSADYDNYQITIGGGVGSTALALGLKLGASATGYNGVLNYSAYSVSAISGAGVSNASSWSYSGVASTNAINSYVFLNGPYLGKTTGMVSAYTENSTTGSTGSFNGFHNSAVSYTDFTFVCGAGNITGGTITVYGYRKA
jgi:hypothetical protein